MIFMGVSIIDKIKRGTKNLQDEVIGFDYYRGADIERMEMYSKIYSKCSPSTSWQTVAVMKKEGFSNSRRLVRTLNARYRNEGGIYTWGLGK